MEAQEAQFDHLIEGLRSGDADVLQEFMTRYRPALERLASRRIQPGMQRRVGPETIAQSVCRTFMRRAQAGQFELTDGDGLWSLLCAIALTKVREKVRYHHRQKRNVDREVALDSEAAKRAAATAPSPEEAAAFSEQIEHEISTFSDEERLVFELRLQDMTQAQIAEQMSCSERTVRRILGRLEARLRAALHAA